MNIGKFIPKFSFVNKALSVLAIAGILTFSANFNLVHADAHIAGGDFMQAFNNTTQQGTWRDPVSGDPGQIIEFIITVKNDGDAPANHVQVIASVDQGPGNVLQGHGSIRPSYFGADYINDTATVNVSGSVPQGLRFIPGHTRLLGQTNLFNCPNSCDIADDVVTHGGMEIGTVQPGDFVQVTFKAGITNVVPPTSTPTPTPTPTPTATPVVTPTPTPGVGGQSQSQTQTQTNEQTVTANGGSATNNNTVTITTTAPAPQVVTVAAAPNVKQLPQTGLPLAGLALGGLLPAGLKLKKFGKGQEDTEETSANHIWEDREFKRS